MHFADGDIMDTCCFCHNPGLLTDVSPKGLESIRVLATDRADKVCKFLIEGHNGYEKRNEQ